MDAYSIKNPSKFNTAGYSCPHLACPCPQTSDPLILLSEPFIKTAIFVPRLHSRNRVISYNYGTNRKLRI